MNHPSVPKIAAALKQAAHAHHEYEKNALEGVSDPNWAAWYCAYVLGALGEIAAPSNLTDWLQNAPDSDDWASTAAVHIHDRFGDDDHQHRGVDDDDYAHFTGFEIIHNAALNRSTAFSTAQRERFGLQGLLPARTCSQEMQIERVLENLRRKKSDIERYIFLIALQGRNERLFYRTLIEHIEEIMPLVYTPTVGEACKTFAHIFRQPRGFYITPSDKGNIRQILDNWPEPDVRVIVITDGERILGLGDLGSNGMGIPIGKAALYTAGAGIDPKHCLPVQLDVGTNNQSLLDDPLYLGVKKKRLTGEVYCELVDEFVDAVQDAYPEALIQFEDFLTPNAYALLNRYRDEVLCFNDDIQGTAAVALGGVHAATRITGRKYSDLRIMFLGAGSAATGIADLMTEAFVTEGISEAEARGRLWFVDVNGLVVAGRTDLMEHNLPYAHDAKQVDFIEALEKVKPHVLIGATGHAGAFTEEAIRTMARLNSRPVIFALSNPTSKAECTAEQAYKWSDGRVVFASGSPFPPIELDDGTIWRPGQGNNVYVFPGIGLGAVGSRANRISDQMFLAAARTLADQVSEENLAEGAIYPDLNRIREVSLEIAVAVAAEAYDSGLAKRTRPGSLREDLAATMYDPVY